MIIKKSKENLQKDVNCTVLSLRTLGNRGGVAIYVNDSFSSKQLFHDSNFVNNVLETCILEINIP